MGLDAFLMPQDPSPPQGSRPIGDLGEALASPPVTLDAPAGDPEPSGVTPLAFPPPEPPPRDLAQAPVRDATASNVAVGLTPGRLVGVAIAPPEIEPKRGTADTPTPEQAPIDRLGLRYSQPAPTPPEVAEKLGGFLAMVGDPAGLLGDDIDRIEEDLMSTAPIVELDWGSDVPTMPRTADHDRGRGPLPTHSHGPPHRWEGASTTPSFARRSPDWDGSGPDLGGDGERIEERLSQVAARLEQAVERLVSPTLSLGRGPRPFRGRLDG
ncbi:hypothetical protein [Paludisphaera sp.]|uniref:hypothetical protein n=1 Tax=Paludisphaera sp. TaxID=2017432 RepID=UPI00301D7E7A